MAPLSSSQKEGMEATTAGFKCDVCDKQFASEAQLAFHKEIEHVKHLPLSGVG